MGGKIVLQILGAAFLIGAQDQLHVALQGDAQFPDATHGQQRRHSGTLVIVGAAAVDQIAVTDQGEGIRIPVVTGSHDVQMGQNMQQIFLLIQIRQTNIALIFPGMHAPLPGQFQGQSQRFGGTGTKGHTGCGFSGDGIDRNQGCQCLHKFLFPAGHPVMDLFFQSHKRSSVFSVFLFSISDFLRKAKD